MELFGFIYPHLNLWDESNRWQTDLQIRCWWKVCSKIYQEGALLATCHIKWMAGVVAKILASHVQIILFHLWMERIQNTLSLWMAGIRKKILLNHRHDMFHRGSQWQNSRIAKFLSQTWDRKYSFKSRHPYVLARKWHYFFSGFWKSLCNYYR